MHSLVKSLVCAAGAKIDISVITRITAVAVDSLRTEDHRIVILFTISDRPAVKNALGIYSKWTQGKPDALNITCGRAA